MSKRKTNVSTKTLEMALTAILSALILIFTFLKIGFIPIGPLAFTINILPVAIGSVLLGWKVGLILGGIFGVASFLTCFGMDVLGTTLFGVNPYFCAVMCIVPRLICGFLPAFIYKAFNSKEKLNKISVPVGCASAALLNTILFLSAMWLFYGSNFRTDPSILGTTTSFKSFLVIMTGNSCINAIVEIAVCLVAGTAVVKALQSVLKKTN